MALLLIEAISFDTIFLVIRIPVLPLISAGMALAAKSQGRAPVWCTKRGEFGSCPTSRRPPYLRNVAKRFWQPNGREYLMRLAYERYS
jgi:hypothetical protein